MDMEQVSLLGLVTIIFTLMSATIAFLIRWISGQTKLQDRVNELTTVVFKLQDDVRNCQRGREDLKTDLNFSQRRIEALESKSGVTPMVHPPGVVVANYQGIIQEFSPSLTPSLGWQPEEMRGGSIEMLIPDDMLEMHRKSFAKAILPTTYVDPNHKIMGYCLDRERRRVPVSISLRKWEGSEIITATIRVRPSADVQSGVPIG